MTRGRNVEDLTILQMALVGYGIEKQKVEEKIRDLQSQLRGRRTALASGAGETMPSPAKRVLSAAARHRIAAAQKKRWAEFHRLKARGRA